MPPPELNNQIVTENGRFNSIPMGTNLTIECARKFLAELLARGGDSVEADIDSGRAMRDFSDEEVVEMLKNFPA